MEEVQNIPKRISPWKYAVLGAIIVTLFSPYFWVACFDGCSTNFHYISPDPFQFFFGLFHYFSLIQITGKFILVLFIIKLLHGEKSFARFAIIILAGIAILFALYLPLFFYFTPEGVLLRFENSIEIGMSRTEVEASANSIIPNVPTEPQATSSGISEKPYDCTLYGAFEDKPKQWYDDYILYPEPYTRKVLVCYDDNNQVVKII